MNHLETLLTQALEEAKKLQKDSSEFTKGFHEGYQASERFYTQASLLEPEEWIVECESTPGVWVRSHDVPGVYSSSLEAQKAIGECNTYFGVSLPRRIQRL